MADIMAIGGPSFFESDGDVAEALATINDVSSLEEVTGVKSLSLH